jgi:hypothetical protein
MQVVVMQTENRMINFSQSIGCAQLAGVAKAAAFVMCSSCATQHAHKGPDAERDF